MKIKKNVQIEFATFKELFEFVRSQDAIECDRDIQSLVELVERCGLIN